MPKYKVPERPSFDAAEALDKKPRPETIYIPADPQWFGDMEIGQEVDFTVRGEIVGIHHDEEKERKRSEVRLALGTVEFYPTTKEAKAVTDEEEDS